MFLGFFSLKLFFINLSLTNGLYVFHIIYFVLILTYIYIYPFKLKHKEESITQTYIRISI